MGGKFGPISIGIAKSDVERLLGKPTDVSRSRKAIILKYGSLQLGFRRIPGRKDDPLNFVGLYFRAGAGGLPESLVVEGWFPTADTTEQEFVTYLDASEVRYRSDDRLTFGRQSGLQVGIGIAVIFGCAGLDSIQFLSDAPSDEVKTIQESK